jgi:hypothetical protein
MRPHLSAALLAGASLALSSQAHAQGNGYVEHKTPDGQAVSFDDDPMGGITGNPVGAQLWGFHPPKRCDLMRPRVTFVPELLKTVEKM